MTFGELTNILLFENENYVSIYDCLHKLHEFYASITGIAAEQTSDKNIFLPTGKAISPEQSANCMLDIRRTIVLMRGIRNAILDLKQELNGEPVHILYAGCGPYAALLTPLTTIFKPEEVRFHLMDVHQRSVSAVEILYTQLDTKKYVEKFICADAATYQLTQPIHLVICEAMQAGLSREPQVSIMLNLIPQLEPRARFVPERVTVSAQLVNREKEIQTHMIEGGEPERINLKNLLVIGRDELASFEGIEVVIPEQLSSFDELQLFTRIDVYADERLDVYNCSITYPVKVMGVGEIAGKTVRFEFKVGEKPGFVWEMV